MVDAAAEDLYEPLGRAASPAFTRSSPLVL